MTHPSWVALHGMVHSFSELNKAVVHVIKLVSFLWLVFSLYALWWRRKRGLWKLPDERDWLRGKWSEVKSLSRVRLFATPRTIAYQASQSMGFSRQEYWNGLPGRQNENHNHRKLTKLITWTTTLSNSMKLWARMCRATQDGRVMLKNSNKMVHWRRERQTTSVFLPGKPMNNMKRQKDKTLKDELPRSVGAQYAAGEEGRNNSRKKWRDGAKAKIIPSCGCDWW